MNLVNNFIGAVERALDLRDWDINDVPAQAAIPASFVPHIYNQGSIEPSCGAGMLATLLNFANPGSVLSMEYCWIQNRLLDGLPLSSGSDMRTLFQAAQNSGSCDETLLEQDVQEPLSTYDSASNITQALVKNAMPRRINFYGFANAPFSWTDLQHIVNTFHMVGARIHLGTGFYNPSWLPQDIFPLKLGTYVDDHFIVLISQDMAKVYGIMNPNPNVQYFVNDWGSNYGQGGIGWFDASYLPQIVELGAISK